LPPEQRRWQNGIEDSQVGDHCKRVGRIDGNRGTCDCKDEGSLIHSYALQENELFWLLLVLGNLLKNASRLVGCLTLLKESNHPEQVGRHRLVQVGKLVLVCLRLYKEDLFTLLLCCGYVHCSMEVVTLVVAEKLHLMLHELVHWHECGLFGRTKPANQLVANVGKP
jgi:hypothetical protein